MNDNNITAMSEKFLAMRSEIVKLCDQAIRVALNIGQKTKAQLLVTFKEQIADEHFRVMVLGSFKRGKSTFINALLGEDVLPNFATPCTAVINEVKWSETKMIRIHFKNPLPKNLPSELTEEAKEHIAKYRNEKQIPPIDIPPDQLEQYVVIPDPAKDQAESIVENPFAYAEVFWPLNLCKNGIEIIDSPGLDEQESRTKVTEQYLIKSDVVLFVQSCSALAGETEVNFIKNNLIANSFDEIIFVCNRFDEVRERERERIIDYAKKKLGNLTKMGPEHGIYFISAADALDGRLEKNDPEKAKRLLEESRLPELENNLYQFLFANCGRIKICGPAGRMNKEIRELNDRVRALRQMFSEKIETLRQRAASAREGAENAKMRINQIIQKLDLEILNLKADVRQKTATYFRHTFPLEVKESMFGYQLQTTLSVNDAFNISYKANKIKEELIKEMTQHTERIQMQWSRGVLSAFVSNRMENVIGSVNVDIADVLTSLDSIRADLSGVQVKSVSNEDNPGGIERLMAGTIGFVAGGPVCAALGGAFGYKELIKGFGITFGLTFCAALLGLTNPFIVLPLIIAAGGIQGMFKMNAMTDKIKIKIIDDYVQQISEKADEIANGISEKVLDNTNDIRKTIETGLMNEVKSILDLADSAIAEKEKGEVESKKHAQILENAEAALDSISSNLNEIIIKAAI